MTGQGPATTTLATAAACSAPTTVTTTATASSTPPIRAATPMAMRATRTPTTPRTIPRAAGGGGAQDLGSGELPFTGTDVIGMTLAGLLALAGGLLLRRREDMNTVR